MDRVREWISDNLRYILLGLAVILLIVIAFFAVRLIQELAPAMKNRSRQRDRQRVEQSLYRRVAGRIFPLTRNDQNILNLMTEYFTALQNKDMDTLR